MVVGPELARLVRHALNRGNVLEGPLRNRIADGGNSGCQGQVSTHGGHSLQLAASRLPPSSFTDEPRLDRLILHFLDEAAIRAR